MAAATLAAGVISIQAQVYSQNIVGYVNVVTPPGFTFVSNPLDYIDSNGLTNNAATNIFKNPYSGNDNIQGPYDGNVLILWTGTGYDQYVFDSLPGDTTTGFTDSFGNPKATPILSPGIGFYINNNNPRATNTITGTVRGATSNGSLTTISNTVTIPNQAFTFVGSATALGGDAITNLLLANPYSGNDNIAGPLDGCQILLPIYNGAGILSAYNTFVFDSLPGDTSTGFTDTFGNPKAAPVIPVGGGFFFGNNVNHPITWTQVIQF